MKKASKVLSAAACILSGVIFSLSAYLNFTLPDSFYNSGDGNLNINCIIDISGQISKDENGTNEAQLKMFGILPVKTVIVQNIERPSLIPCGTPFGIKILTDGVVVTGFGQINDYHDLQHTPAVVAGFEKGDIITEINGNRVTSANEMINLISKYKDNLVITYSRNGINNTVSAKPICDDEGTPKLGLWVRDSTAGIGTMTFYDPQRGIYGGLGHAVNDIDTGQKLPLYKGEIVTAIINNVIKGQSGVPGELCGTLMQGSMLGSIYANTDCGLYGTAHYCPSSESPIPMALKQEVETGEAYIISTVENNTPQKYSIEIQSINLNSSDKKNMVIKITDERLLKATGGIVQGMSGSPIIQNDMLVGAVTHVFISDPTKGYGIFAETMYKMSLDTLQFADLAA